MRSDPRFVNHVSKWSTAELSQAARAVRDVVHTPGWSILISLLDDVAAEVRGSVGDKALSHEDYALRDGKMAGLEALKAVADSVLLAWERREKEIESSPEPPVGAGVGG